MIREWLKKEERNTNNPKFFIIDFVENDVCDTNKLKKFLANQVLIHLEKPKRLIRLYKSEPTSELNQHILNLTLPPENAPFSPRQSFWAEIVSAEILEKINKCLIPIYKLRYKETRDKAMRGKADVVACKILENKPIIIFSEVKSKTNYISPRKANKLAETAFEGLSKNNVEKPEIIDYISKILDDLPEEIPNKYDLIHLFDEALKDPRFYSKDFQIFFIFEKHRWKNECLGIYDNEKLRKVPNLTINIVLIDSMQDIIDDTYSLVPIVAEEVVYSE